MTKAQAAHIPHLCLQEVNGFAQGRQVRLFVVDPPGGGGGKHALPGSRKLGRSTPVTALGTVH